MSGTLDEVIARLEAFKARLPGLIRDDVQTVAEQITKDFQEESPKGESEPHLADSFSYALTEENESGASATVSSNQQQKLEWVTFGTGIYGPREHRIVPVVAPALYWEGAAHPYASVAGQHPNDFVETVQKRAAQRVQEQIQTLRTDAAALLEEG
jgi:hypothetical protein